MANLLVLPIGTDTTYSFVLKDSDDDSFVETGTINGTLKDGEADSASTISGQTFPESFSYSGSGGRWTCPLDSGLSLTDGIIYWFHIVQTAPKNREWRIPMQAQHDNG